MPAEARPTPVVVERAGLPDPRPESAAPTPSRPWFPALTGLRGIAIALVVAGHLEAPLIVGGTIGVTIFFVLSGFLITSLLIDEAGRTGKIDLRAFYARRCRRLAPALLVAVAVVAVVAAARGQANQVLGDSFLALTYVANWARADGALMGVWNHAWSLSIEEQAYLVWPLAFLVGLRWAPPTSGRAIATVGVLALASAGLRVALTVGGAPEERIYFGTDTRAEALLAGCALAGVVARGTRLARPQRVAAIAGVALALLALTPSDTLLLAGDRHTFVAIATSTLILALAQTEPSALVRGPMAWLGERSYSLYLWHVPVVLALADTLAGEPPFARMLTMAAISVGLAAASYTFVEQPFRRAGATGRRPSARLADLVAERSG